MIACNDPDQLQAKGEDWTPNLKDTPQQQLLCITFASEDGHAHSAEPIFIDFSRNEGETPDKTVNVLENVAAITEDISIETKLKVLEAVLPPEAVKPAKADKVCSNRVKNIIPKKCPQCDETYKNQKLLSKHIKEVHASALVCNTCGLEFARATQLLYHERRVHLQERSQTCHFCSRGFFKRSDLKTHLRLHLGILTNTCETCGRHFHHRSNLLRHARLHSGVKPYVCSSCGQRFVQASALKNHIAHRHPSGSKKFPCPSCGKVLSSLAVLKKHSRMVHKTPLMLKPVEVGERKRHFYCKVCGLKYGTKSLLMQHEEETHSKTEEFHCKSCDQKLKTSSEVKEHRCISQIRDATRKEFLALQTDLLEEEEREQAVEEEEAAANMREMVIHVQAAGQNELMAVHVKYNLDYLVPGEPPSQPPQLTAPVKAKETVIAEEEPKEKEAAKKFHCTECGKNFKKKHNFAQHKATHDVDMKRYTCPFCSQVYAWKTSLNKHVLTQHTQKSDTFLCNLCPKSFTRSQAFHEHIRRDHLGVRPHKCTDCDKTFFKRNDLTVHLRTHANDRPYICGTCGKTFSHISHIIRHERIHSGVRPYSCDICGKSFVQSSTLNVHRKRIHEGISVGTVGKQTEKEVSSTKVEEISAPLAEPIMDSLYVFS